MVKARSDNFRGSLGDVTERMEAVLEVHLNSKHEILGTSIVLISEFNGTFDYIGTIFYAVEY
jgi:hypothetical protein